MKRTLSLILGLAIIMSLGGSSFATKIETKNTSDNLFIDMAVEYMSKELEFSKKNPNEVYTDFMNEYGNSKEMRYNVSETVTRKVNDNVEITFNSNGNVSIEVVNANELSTRSYLTPVTVDYYLYMRSAGGGVYHGYVHHEATFYKDSIAGIVLDRSDISQEYFKPSTSKTTYQFVRKEAYNDPNNTYARSEVTFKLGHYTGIFNTGWTVKNVITKIEVSRYGDVTKSNNW